MTKNTYNPYEIMMDKYDKEEMLSDVREAMLYQLGVDVSCEELNHFFTGKGKAALSGCAEWQQCFAVEKMLDLSAPALPGGKRTASAARRMQLI